MSDTEEHFRSVTPDGKIAIEVLLREGAYEGKVITCGVVTEEFYSAYQKQLLIWAERQMKEAMRRCKVEAPDEAKVEA